jgi:hypothetical protein
MNSKFSALALFGLGTLWFGCVPSPRDAIQELKDQIKVAEMNKAQATLRFSRLRFFSSILAKSTTLFANPTARSNRMA